MTWSSSPPEQPVDPALAASAAALLSALVREEPLPIGAHRGDATAGVPAQRTTSSGLTDVSPSVVPAEGAGLPTEQARRKGLFGRR